MKTLIVYFSLEGHTKQVAEHLANQLQADLMELKPVKNFPTKGLKKYFCGVKSIFLKEHPKLVDLKIDFRPYNTIIIGTPIWASCYSAPIRTFLRQYQFDGKNVAAFACHAGGGADKCFARLKETLANHNHWIGEQDFPKQEKDAMPKKADLWISQLSLQST